MLAVLFSLKAFHKELSGKHVLVRIDNMTAVSDLGKMGTSHSKKRNDLTRTLWEWCLDNNMWLITSHIPAKENTLANEESRKSRKETEWTLEEFSTRLLRNFMLSLRMTYLPLGLITS